jgi:hypothetical protein
VSSNAFTDHIESLAPFADLSTSLTRLLLARNSFVGSRMLLNVDQMPRLVEVDLSDNAGVTGKLTQSVDPGRSMVLAAAGSTRFECPTPPFPSTMIVTLSAAGCRQVFGDLLKLSGYVAVGAAAGGMIICLTKLHQRSRFLRVLAMVVWLAGCLSFFNDGALLFDMVATVTGKTTNCNIINRRGVFEVFLPLRDISGFIGLRQGYMGSRGPICFCGNETAFPGEGFLDLRVDPPPREQTFVEYMTVYTRWAIIDDSIKPYRQLAAFRNLCLRFPQCNLAPGRSDQVCGALFDDSWRNKDDYGFLVCVVLLLVWRGVLEALKLAVIVASFVAGRIVGREFAMPFLQSSPFLPLTGAFGVDWVGEVLRYQRTYQDHLRFFAVQGLLNSCPFLVLQFYYVNVVLQTGLSTMSYVSLVVNFVFVPLMLVRACVAVYNERTARTALVDEIIAHSRQSSAASKSSDSAVSVDVELWSVSRDRSLTWGPLDLSGSSSASPTGQVAALSGCASSSEDDTCTGNDASGRAEDGLVNQTLQLDADSASDAGKAVATLCANQFATLSFDRVAAAPVSDLGLDDKGLLPAVAIKSDTTVHF